MIIPEYIQACAFPWILIGPHGKISAFGDGLIWKIPDEDLRRLVKLPVYRLKNGWAMLDQSWAAYVLPTQILGGSRLVIIVKRKPNAVLDNDRNWELPSEFSVEQYAKHLVYVMNQIESGVSGLIYQSIHEIRDINSNIKNATHGYLSKVRANYVGVTEDIDVVKGIEAFSDIISARTEYMELIANPVTLNLPMRSLRIRKKFEAMSKYMSLDLINKSGFKVTVYGGDNTFVRAMSVLDVVPYILLQNAMKYSPSGYTIEVYIVEEESHVTCTVKNLGMKLEDIDQSSVFSYRKRGGGQVQGISGNGIGLFFMKHVIENLHNGKVFFRQGNAVLDVGGLLYAITEVGFKLPK